MDLRDGEVRYKTAACFALTAPSPGSIGLLMRVALATLGRYYDGLQRVVQGEQTPEESINVIEE